MKKALFLVLALMAMAACSKDPVDRDGKVTYSLTQAKSAKRGVSFNFGSIPDIDIPLLGNAVSWSYDWSNRALDAVSDAQFSQYGMDWCPMCWNNNYSADNIRAYKKAHPEAKYILAYNEPNLTDQANMTPAQAAEKWPQLVALARELGMELVSPALNYGTLEGYHDPIVWMDEFLSQEGVSLDDMAAIAVHCYMPSAGGVKTFIERFAKYGKPVWLTEFCNGANNNITEATQMAYMSETLNMLEGNPRVQRYAWFIPRGVAFNRMWHNNLLTAEQPFGLTPLGKVFVNFSTFDKNIRYRAGEVIPAEQYSAASGYVHLAPSTDGGILDISELGKDGYVEYQLDMAFAGTYQLKLRYQTYMDTSLGFSVNGTEVASKTFSTTSQQWTSGSFDIVLPEGKSVLRITGKSAATIMLNWLKINK